MGNSETKSDFPPSPIWTLAEELADWAAQDYPLSGWDVINMLCERGLLHPENAKQIADAAMRRHNGPPATELNRGDFDEDAKIPF
ncbi:hypothetical protein Hden_1531 [Hyphomicrobium denitrificans ATCC 51888]|uniref:Uncharacterized protein n=1 Tax=Hyphomicrobium denitrificans (strain ATCC 51888 / DSM 1869 / NCIMB 11706 / TK 0415) TaxID=582899 RepID=D8JQ17_HYPDA|nr:hypothetical protein [Hyphomicrobium denitrificans]ADJ21938.1 hypothetical protein Hden_0111 [Hyphomicrobium denitrificans ATCC 51888]ADJ23343.1 hypothetical protein Hden_1531 [Hyphomicrobium denitrificans ATCC 51888]